MADIRSEGYDAVDGRGKKVQIKSRRSESEGRPKLIGRTGRFSNHKFDYALLAILGRDYKPVQVWKLSYRVLKPIIDEEKRNAPRLQTK